MRGYGPDHRSHALFDTLTRSRAEHVRRFCCGTVVVLSDQAAWLIESSRAAARKPAAACRSSASVKRMVGLVTHWIVTIQAQWWH